jgi:hypothetical protein
MHRLQGHKGLISKITVGDHHEIEIALVGLEVANGERAVEIHTNELATENRSHSR